LPSSAMEVTKSAASLAEAKLAPRDDSDEAQDAA
jgi:hypothetical protein